MFKAIAKNCYKYKNLHAHNYGYAEGFENTDSLIKPLSVVCLSSFFACVGLLSGGLPLGIALGIVTAVITQLTFVDFLAATVPNPKNHALIPSFFTRKEGISKGKQDAKLFNNKLEEDVSELVENFVPKGIRAYFR